VIQKEIVEFGIFDWTFQRKNFYFYWFLFDDMMIFLIQSFLYILVILKCF